MPNKKENIKPKTKSPKEKMEDVVVCLPEYQKDLSHLMTPENRRPEIEEQIRQMVAKHKGKSLKKAS